LHQPRKRFGQNFLHDPWVIQRILDAVNAQPGQHLVEIGPGQGAITAGLLQMAGALDVIELDRDLIAPLAERFNGQVIDPVTDPITDQVTDPVTNQAIDQQSMVEVDHQPPPRLRIHNADALTFKLCNLLAAGSRRRQSLGPTDSLQDAADRSSQDQGPNRDLDPGLNHPGQAQRTEHRLRLIGNLPYNISTPLLFHFIDQADCIQDMHLMLQKEVVDRITAEPGTKVYGRLSVMVQTFCSAERLFLVSAGAFHPAPKVSSAVVRLQPHRPSPYPLSDPCWHARIVAAAFAQRRKTLRNSLSGLVSTQQMQALEIDPGARAETLSVNQFATLANASSACISASIP
jgi:16S rRNA (adenine1518-N6/adenine1519-N6)-dimethyltransferase